MFKKSLALLLSVLMAFSFAMVASANTLDYAEAAVAVEAEYTFEPMVEDVPSDDTPGTSSSNSILPPSPDGFWDYVRWLPRLILNFLAFLFNWVGVGLGLFARWADDVGAVDGLGALVGTVGLLAAAATILIPILNMLRGWASGD